MERTDDRLCPACAGGNAGNTNTAPRAGRRTPEITAPRTGWGGTCKRRMSYIVVKCEFVGMGAEANFLAFLLPLVPDPRVDHVGREPLAVQEELVVGLEVAQGLVPRRGRPR